jgi:hypothetical protein
MLNHQLILTKEWSTKSNSLDQCSAEYSVSSGHYVPTRCGWLTNGSVIVRIWIKKGIEIGYTKDLYNEIA